MQKCCTDPVNADNIATSETVIKSIREQVVCEKDDYDG
jgi:hypothetical protein